MSIGSGSYGYNEAATSFSNSLGSTQSLTNIQAASDAWGKFIPMTGGYTRVGGALVWGSPYYKNTEKFQEGTQFVSHTFEFVNGERVDTDGKTYQTGITTKAVETYFIDLAYSVGFELDSRAARKLSKVRVNGVVVYDVITGAIAPGIAFSIRSGRELSIDPVMKRYPDTGIYFYPGQTYIVFDRFPLASFGGGLPQSVDIEFSVDAVGAEGRQNVFPITTDDNFGDKQWVSQDQRRLYVYRPDLFTNGGIATYNIDTGERLDDVQLTGAAAALKAGRRDSSLGGHACGRKAGIGIISTEQGVGPYYAIDLVNGPVVAFGVGGWLNVQYFDGDEMSSSFIGPNFSYEPFIRLVKVSRVVGSLVVSSSNIPTPYPRTEQASWSAQGDGYLIGWNANSAYIYDGVSFAPIPLKLNDGDYIDSGVYFDKRAALVMFRAGASKVELWSADEMFYSIPSNGMRFHGAGGLGSLQQAQADTRFGYYGSVFGQGFQIVDLRTGSVRTYGYAAGSAVWDSQTRQFVQAYTDGASVFRVYGPNVNTAGISLFSFLQSLYAYTGRYDFGQVRNDGVDDVVKGAFINAQFDVDTLVSNICTAYRIEKIEDADGILFYRNRTAAGALSIAAVIPIAEMAVLGQEDGAALLSARRSASTTPSAITLGFLDVDNEFKENSVTFTRTDGVNTNNPANIKLPFVMTVQDALAVCQAAVQGNKTLSETHQFRLPPKYAYIRSRDIIQIVSPGITNTIRVTQDDLGGDFSVTCTGETVAVKIGVEPVAPVLPPRNVNSTGAVVLTTAYILDVPTLRVADDPGAGKFAQYDIVAPVKAGAWNGGYLARTPAVGDPVTLFHAYGPSIACVIKTTNKLSNRRWITDADTLSGSVTGTYVEDRNTTKAKIDADDTLNLALYGLPGRWEVIQFESLKGSVLSGIVRGLRGTEIYCGKHAVGDLVIILEHGVAVEARDVSVIGSKETYKAVSDGNTFAGTAAVIENTPAGNSLKPFAPSRLRAVHNRAGDVVLSWVRRDRLAKGWGKPLALSEVAEAYRVTVFGADGVTVVRTIDTAETTALYQAGNVEGDGAMTAGTLTVSVAMMGATGPGLAEARRVYVGSS